MEVGAERNGLEIDLAELFDVVRRVGIRNRRIREEVVDGFQTRAVLCRYGVIERSELQGVRVEEESVGGKQPIELDAEACETFINIMIFHFDALAEVKRPIFKNRIRPLVIRKEFRQEACIEFLRFFHALLLVILCHGRVANFLEDFPSMLDDGKKERMITVSSPHGAFEKFESRKDFFVIDALAVRQDGLQVVDITVGNGDAFHLEAWHADATMHLFERLRLSRDKEMMENGFLQEIFKIV